MALIYLELLWQLVCGAEIQYRYPEETVFTDSQAALRRIQNDKEGPGQAFMGMVYRRGRDLLKKNPTIEIIYNGYLYIEVCLETKLLTIEAAIESLKCVWSTTSLSHINRVVRGR
jgi:hypothetical protein